MGIDIVVDELADDWLMIHPVLSDFRMEVELERLPGLLNQTLIAWFRERPLLRVRSTLGVVEGGSTVAVHVWFDAREATKSR
jgi:hypothetical protein